MISFDQGSCLWTNPNCLPHLHVKFSCCCLHSNHSVSGCANANSCSLLTRFWVVFLFWRCGKRLHWKHSNWNLWTVQGSSEMRRRLQSFILFFSLFIPMYLSACLLKVISSTSALLFVSQKVIYHPSHIHLLAWSPCWRVWRPTTQTHFCSLLCDCLTSVCLSVCENGVKRLYYALMIINIHVMILTSQQAHSYSSKIFSFCFSKIRGRKKNHCSFAPRSTLTL